MPTVLIAGATRGIGLEFARQAAGDGWRVIGTARTPERAEALRETGAEVQPLDLTDPASIHALADALDGQAIDLLFANGGTWAGDDAAGDAARWAAAFATNCTGPTLLAQALRPHVAASAEKRMVAVTSGMGSIGDNTGGGAAPYRASKAALNMAWKTLSLRRDDGVTVNVINPGWVATDMGGSSAPTSPTDSVAGMRRVIAALRPEDTGRFLSWDGREYPW